MKQIFLSSILLIILFSCKKETDNRNCKLVAETQRVGNTTSTTNYYYDNQGRIIGIQGQNSDTKYEYFPDSVKQSTNQVHTNTFYLNSRGLVDSSRHYFNPNPNELGLRDYFSYNADGFLTGITTLFSQRYNGNIIVDTITSSYIIVNGNITSFTQDGFTIDYEYGTEVPPNNRLLSPGYLSALPFFGKNSHNILRKSTDDGGQVTTFTYRFDARGNVIQKTAVTSSPTLPPNYTQTTDYSYNCN